MPKKSRYVLVVDNISTSTPLRDIEREMAYFGKVRDCIKDTRARCALVEFEKSLDCSAAWRKMDGCRMDGRDWKVDYATPDDFKLFKWRWFEHSPSPPRRKYSRSRSRSRSPSRSPSPKPRSPSRSPSRGRSPRPRSPSPTKTPYNDSGNDKRKASNTPSRTPPRDD